MENEIKRLDSPFSDNELEYNVDTGRYQLTIAKAKSLVEVCPFKNDAILQRRIKDTSRLVYNYILSRCHTANKPLVDFLLNRTENGRKFIKECLCIQMEADFLTGVNTLGKMSAVNMQNGSVMDRNALALNRICIDCEEEIRQSQNYFCGINIIYAAPYPYSVYIIAGVN